MHALAGSEPAVSISADIRLMKHTIYPNREIEMAMKPNYRYERSQRDKAKAAKKEAKLVAKVAKEKPSSTEQEEAREPAAGES